MSDPITASFEPFEADAFAPRVIVPLTAGTCLGERFEIVRALDSGGYSVVYLANDRVLKRTVALKVLRADRASENAVRRFRQEAAFARDVEHPALVRIFDVQESDSSMYLVMEYVTGESLRRRLERGAFSVDEAIHNAAQLLSGISVLHERHIVHRDIKPANILLDESGNLKLADFGLARQLYDDSSQTATGALLGTADYISPEQIRGATADQRSDLYAVGIVLFETIAGRLPYEAATSWGRLLARFKDAPDVRKFRADCPFWFARIIARLMEQSPALRYQSASDVLADLSSHRRPAFQLRHSNVLFGAVLVAALTMLGVSWQNRQQHRFHRLEETVDGIAAIDRAGDILWTRANVEAASAREKSAIANINGKKVVASLFRPRIDRGSRSAALRLTLVDPQTDELIRAVALPSVAHIFADTSDSFVADRVDAVDLDGDGSDEVIVTCIHVWDSPSYVLVYEPRLNRTRIAFMGSGHHRFTAATEIDGNGQQLLLTGINNRLGWMNVAAAVRFDPPIGVAGRLEAPLSGSSPDDLRDSPPSNVTWYTLLPRSTMGLRCRINVTDAGYVVHLPNGTAFRLARDGQPVQARHDGDALRARDRAWELLREADHRRTAGQPTNAVESMRQAVAIAVRTGDRRLLEVMQRRYGAALIAAGHTIEGEQVLDELVAHSENAPEICYYDAAIELHKRGALLKAVAWYSRGLALASPGGEGKAKPDFLEGRILALVEMHRYDDALAAIATFDNTFPGATHPAFWTEYVRWRAGRSAGADLRLPPNCTDLQAYVQLELANVANVPPADLIKRIDREYETHSQIRSALLSLHAELLAEAGNPAAAKKMISLARDLLIQDESRGVLARAHAEIVKARYNALMK